MLGETDVGSLGGALGRRSRLAVRDRSPRAAPRPRARVALDAASSSSAGVGLVRSRHRPPPARRARAARRTPRGATGRPAGGAAARSPRCASANAPALGHRSAGPAPARGRAPRARRRARARRRDRSRATSASRMRRRTSSSLPPLKSGRRMSISARTMPTVKMSLRASSSRPTTCSGDMYPSFPLSCPASVRRSISAARAMPKSVSFTAPDRSMRTLPGDTSRCTSASGLAVVVARGVRVVERAQDRKRDVQADVERDRPRRVGRGANEARAGRAVDVLHRHVELAVLLAEVEHLDDVRVAEARADPRLVDEHGDEVRVARVLREDALDRDDLLEAVRAGAPREIDLRHPARRDPPEQLVRPQAQGRRDGGGRHRLGAA